MIPETKVQSPERRQSPSGDQPPVPGKVRQPRKGASERGNKGDRELGSGRSASCSHLGAYCHECSISKGCSMCTTPVRSGRLLAGKFPARFSRWLVGDVSPRLASDGLSVRHGQDGQDHCSSDCPVPGNSAPANASKYCTYWGQATGPV